MHEIHQDIEHYLHALEHFWGELAANVPTIEESECIAEVVLLADYHIASEKYERAEELRDHMDEHQRARFDAVLRLKEDREPAILLLRDNP